MRLQHPHSRSLCTCKPVWQARVTTFALTRGEVAHALPSPCCTRLLSHTRTAFKHYARSRDYCNRCYAPRSSLVRINSIAALRPIPYTQTAFKCYVRSRDYCTTSRHVVSMCLAVVRTALELGNFVHVANYVAKAEQAPDVPVGSHADKDSCRRTREGNQGTWLSTWPRRSRYLTCQWVDGWGWSCVGCADAVVHAGDRRTRFDNAARVPYVQVRMGVREMKGPAEPSARNDPSCRRTTP